MELGMIGLGRMGANMTERLVKGGHRVVGFDPKPEARARVEGKGAAWAVAHRIAKIVWLVLHQEVEYQEKGSAPPNERTLVRKFKRLLKEFGSVGLVVRALLDQQLPAPA